MCDKNNFAKEIRMQVTEKTVDSVPVEVTILNIRIASEMINELKNKFIDVSVCKTLELGLVSDLFECRTSFFARSVSFGDTLKPSYLPPPWKNTGWLPTQVRHLATLLFHSGPTLFAQVERLYVTDQSTSVQHVRSFPVAYLMPCGTLRIEYCSQAHRYQGAQILMIKCP
jgi:hypothetical protein